MIKKILLPLIVALTSLVILGCLNQESPLGDTVVNIAEISGVTAPAYGAAPVTTITETAQYTGTVTWNGTPATFAASTIYTATITLTAKAGYTLVGVAANSFTVMGATATNNANSGVVSANFTQTVANLLSASDVTSSSQTSITLKAVQGGSFESTSTMTVSSLRMSEKEITGEQFAAVMGVPDPSYRINVVNNPFELLSWYQTLVFCNKLNVADGLTPVYSISGTTNTAT